MAVKIRPVGDHVLVEPIEEKQVKKGGIVVPDSAQEKPQQGVVLAAGPGKRDDEGKLTAMEVKAGDTVLMSRYGGTDIEYDGRKYKILSAGDILAVIR